MHAHAKGSLAVARRCRFVHETGIANERPSPRETVSSAQTMTASVPTESVRSVGGHRYRNSIDRFRSKSSRSIASDRNRADRSSVRHSRSVRDAIEEHRSATTRSVSVMFSLGAGSKRQGMLSSTKKHSTLGIRITHSHSCRRSQWMTQSESNDRITRRLPSLFRNRT